MSSNDYGGYGTAEKQRKALSDAMNTSMSKYADQWSQYSTKPWVENTQKDAKLNDYQLSQKLLTEKKIEQATTQLEKVELAIIDVQQKKDELKTIETMKTGNSRTNIQMKMASNQAYRTLTSQETQLETQKNQLEKQINSYKNKVEKIDLASDAGKIFSAGIRTDAVMDIDAPPRNPITSSAMTPEERAFSLDKQNSLIDPNFSLNDIAKGFVGQGASYIGGKETILDRALLAPAQDFVNAIFNPKQSQLDLDYGYTNTQNSIKEISNNPDTFVGNVIAETTIGLVGAKAGGVAVKTTAKAVKTGVNAIKKTPLKSGLEDIPTIKSESDLLLKTDIAKDDYNELSYQAYKFLENDIAPHRSKFIDKKFVRTPSSEVVELSSLSKSKSPQMVNGDLRLVDDVPKDVQLINKEIVNKAFTDAKIMTKIDRPKNPRSSSYTAMKVSKEMINPPIKLSLSSKNREVIKNKFIRQINIRKPFSGVGNDIRLDGMESPSNLSGYVELRDPTKIYLQKNAIGVSPEDVINTINHESIHNVLNKNIGVIAGAQMDNIAYASRFMDKKLKSIDIRGKWGKKGFDKVVDETSSQTKLARKKNRFNYYNELQKADVESIQSKKTKDQLENIALGGLGATGTYFTAGVFIGKTPTKKQKTSKKKSRTDNIFNFKY